MLKENTNCSCRKGRDPTLIKFVCPVAEYANRTEYTMKKIVQEVELPKQFIYLEVQQLGDKEVEIAKK